MASKTFSLSVGERHAAIDILNAFKGSLEKLAVVLEDIKAFPLTNEEWDGPAKRVVTKLEDGQESWTWSEEYLKEISVQEATLEYLKSEIDAKSARGEYTVNYKDRAAISLRVKLVA